MLSKAKQNSNNTMILLAVIGLLALANVTNWLTTADNVWFDWLTREYAVSHRADPQILIIEIDDRSLSRLEQSAGRWPWSRSIYGYLLEGLLEVEPKAVVFDILFSERDQYRPDDDAYFAEMVDKLVQAKKVPVFFSASLLAENAPVTAHLIDSLPENLFFKPHQAEHHAEASAATANTGTANPRAANTGLENMRTGKVDVVITETSATKKSATIKINIPWGLMAENWTAGLINFDADSDGVSRYYQTYRRVGDRYLYSLPLKVVTEVFSADKAYPQKFRLQFKGDGLVPYRSISFSDALALLDNPTKAREIFSGKLLLIGATATGLHDLRSSPIAELYPATSILATAIDNLKNESYWTDVNGFVKFMVTLLPLLLLMGFLHWQRVYLTELWMGSVVLISISLVLFALSYFTAMHRNLLIPAFSPVLLCALFFVGMLFVRGIEVYFARQHALQTFSRFMDPIVVTQLLSDEQWTKKLEPQTRQISILFSDIRGFTTLSEQRTAKQVMQMLNQYFDKQVDTIFEHQGTLDKFIGDAIMAFWGAPLDDREHALHAVSAAMAMVDNLIEFRRSLPQELQNFDVGIGVHSGEAVVGMLGSHKRFDYTAIGDSVNLASRIEGVTKGLARVLVSEATKDLCENHFQFEFRGEFQVKGREKTVRLYEPIASKNETEMGR